MDNAPYGSSAAAARLPFSVVHGEALDGLAVLVPAGVGERVIHGGVDGVNKPCEADGPEAGGDGARVDGRAPERLGGVDVSNAGHDTLVEQGGLDGGAPPFQGATKRRGVERGTRRIGAEYRLARASRAEGDGGERTRIHETDSRAVVEEKDHARVRGQGIGDQCDVPVAVHAKVDVQRAAVVEGEILVLATPFYVRDLPPHELGGHTVGEGSSGCGMVGRNHGETPAGDGRAESAHGVFDFWKFGHAGKADGRKDQVRGGAQVRCAALGSAYVTHSPAGVPAGVGPAVPAMAKQRSLKHEYTSYMERAVEEFKDSIPRSALLAIGDEAVAALGAEAQTTLTELVLWAEVDRLIAGRLGLPRYATWCQRRRRQLARLRDAGRCGLTPDGVVASTLRAAAGGHVLLAGTPADEATLFSAAHGCRVTVLTTAPKTLDRLFAAADDAGVGSQVRGCVCELGGWEPDVSLRVVVCTPDALGVLSTAERAAAIDGLRRATPVGGVHLLHGGPRAPVLVSLDEWQSWYPGWAVSADRTARTAAPSTLIACHTPESAGGAQ